MQEACKKAKDPPLQKPNPQGWATPEKTESKSFRRVKDVPPAFGERQSQNRLVKDGSGRDRAGDLRRPTNASKAQGSTAVSAQRGTCWAQNHPPTCQWSPPA